LRRAGIKRVEGRLVGDDSAFEGAPLGGGWSWDYLADGYAAGSTALNYNENVVRLTIAGAPSAGTAAVVSIAGPPGHGLEIVNETTTGETNDGLSVRRLPGSSRLIVRGAVAPGRRLARTVAVDDPTSFFLRALEHAVGLRGITVAHGIGMGLATQAASPVAPQRQLIARRESPPLSVLAAHCLKASQNMYAETLLKTLGRSADMPGSIASGRRVVQDVLSAWDVPRDAYVIADGSGLSRYDYVTADALVTILTRMWRDDRHRGPFAAALPVGARDGTLASRMRETVLDTNVQAKTGTIANVRALSGYVRTRAGEPLAFSMIVNHFTVPSAEIDGIVERALVTLVEGRPPSAPRPGPMAPVTAPR
jgi:D-alanyl-D-alanine carboxypeptidase/D-alanyl-D-alanine-endopeptidase (penicillin-binding protein 4)